MIRKDRAKFMKTQHLFFVFVCIFGVIVLYYAAKFVLPVPNQSLDPRFTDADTNHDGKLDEKELTDYIAVLNQMKISAPQKVVTDKSKNESEKLYGEEGSYLKSAMGATFP
jgi:hypothetical protein